MTGVLVLVLVLVLVRSKAALNKHPGALTKVGMFQYEGRGGQSGVSTGPNVPAAVNS